MPFFVRKFILFLRVMYCTFRIFCSLELFTFIILKLFAVPRKKKPNGTMERRLVLQQDIRLSVCCINWKSLRCFAWFSFTFTTLISSSSSSSSSPSCNIALCVWQEASSWSLTYTKCVIAIRNFVCRISSWWGIAFLATFDWNSFYLNCFEYSIWMRASDYKSLSWLEIKVKHQFKEKNWVNRSDSVLSFDDCFAILCDKYMLGWKSSKSRICHLIRRKTAFHYDFKSNQIVLPLT